jgi:S-formylglutathione hydrolase FrmB
MHKPIKCVVVTPEGYTTGSQRYPVVYLLHGHGGSYNNWVRNTATLQPYVDALKLIVVCPDGNVSSWYFDSPADTAWKYETHVALEVPDYIDAHYRTVADRNGRAITGLSMGGHGGLYLGIKHKDRFGAAGSTSGGVDFRPFPGNWNIAQRLGTYADNEQQWDKNTVINVADELKSGELALIIDCGVDDFFITVNRNLHRKLVEKKIAHDYTERPGKHNWDYWNNALPYQLLYFSRFFHQQNRLNG